MEYREFGKTGIKLSGLGLGMNRFQAKQLQTKEGIHAAAEIVKAAIRSGINYIDVARNYSGGKAFSVLREALNTKEVNMPVHLCVKLMLNHTDKTKESALKGISEQLNELNIQGADFCFAQAVKSYEEYGELMQPGGLYEGFLEARDRGWIHHICLSSHATVEDTLRIMEERKFAGYTITYHLLNCMQMKPLLEKAKECEVGILTMNSLAGGLIPQNPQLFGELGKTPKKICQMALQYIYRHSEVSSVLSGMQSLDELYCNVEAIEHYKDFELEKMEFFEKEFYQKNGLCTGCDYCKGCPKDIPIKSFMYSYNAFQWDNTIYAEQYGRKEKALLDNIRLTQEMMHHGYEFPAVLQNSCIECGSCEKKCTQSLPIIERIRDIHKRIGNTILNRKEFIKKLKAIKGTGRRKVAFYPNSATVKTILQEYIKEFGQPEFSVFIFDRNQRLWGEQQLSSGVTVHIVGIESIPEIKPDCIVIAHYIMQEKLYKNIGQYVDEQTEIIKIYNQDDVPFVYLGG